MSDDTKQDDTELFASEESDGSTDSHLIKHEDEDLDLDKEEKEAIREAQKQKQLKVWAERIRVGEAHIETLPKNLQWMVPELNNMLAPQPQVNVDEIVEQKLREYQVTQTFNALKNKLDAISLTKSEKAEIAAEYKDLLPGLTKDKALEKALKITGVFQKLTTDNEALRRSMQLPASQRTVPPSEIKSLSEVTSFEELQKLPPEKRIELYEKQALSVKR